VDGSVDINGDGGVGVHTSEGGRSGTCRRGGANYKLVVLFHIVPVIENFSTNHVCAFPSCTVR
jgi:hypothetical protein